MHPSRECTLTSIWWDHPNTPAYNGACRHDLLCRSISAWSSGMYLLIVFLAPLIKRQLSVRHFNNATLFPSQLLQDIFNFISRRLYIRAGPKLRFKKYYTHGYTYVNPFSVFSSDIQKIPTGSHKKAVRYARIGNYLEKILNTSWQTEKNVISYPQKAI